MSGSILVGIHAELTLMLRELAQWRAFGVGYNAVKDSFPGLEAAIDAAMAPPSSSPPLPQVIAPSAVADAKRAIARRRRDAKRRGR